MNEIALEFHIIKMCSFVRRFDLQYQNRRDYDRSVLGGPIIQSDCNFGFGFVEFIFFDRALWKIENIVSGEIL